MRKLLSALVALLSAVFLMADVVTVQAEPQGPEQPEDELAVIWQHWLSAYGASANAVTSEDGLDSGATGLGAEKPVRETQSARQPEGRDLSLWILDPPGSGEASRPGFSALARSRSRLWFGTASAEPRIYVFDTLEKSLKDVSPVDSRLAATSGIQSAGVIRDLVILGGPGLGGGVNLFAFRADDGSYLGSQTLLEYDGIGKWVSSVGVTYTTAKNASGGGSVLRWRGDAASPFRFEVVGLLDGEGIDLAAHEGRLFAATGPDDASLAGLYMSPTIPRGGLTSTSVESWEKVWQVDAYEPDALTARAYRCGALASFGGYLYWGTSHRPFEAAQAHFAQRGFPAETPQVLAVIGGTYRAATIFRGRNFGSYPEVELLYGMDRLPVYDDGWRLVPNLLGVPRWGPSGFGTFFNTSVSSMVVHKGQLYVGMSRWQPAVDQALRAIQESSTNRVPDEVADVLAGAHGAGLYSFSSTISPAVPVNAGGEAFDGGNAGADGSSVGAMLSADVLYLSRSRSPTLVLPIEGVGEQASDETGDDQASADRAEDELPLEQDADVGSFGSVEGVAATSTPTATESPSRPPATTVAVHLNPDVLWPDRPAPQPVIKTSKVGVGVYALHAGDDVVDSLLAIKPGVILLQDPDINFARKVRYLFPRAFIIGRTFVPNQALDNPEHRGAALADKVAKMAVPFSGLIDAWQGYNEPVGHNDYKGYEAYNRLQVAFARRLQDHYGIPAVCGNDSPGAIEPEDYPKYFAEAIRVSRYFGIHAYAGPNALALNTPDAEYFALRYRKIHDELEKAGIKNVQMVITEVGLGNGWRGHVSEEAMAREFRWLADEMEKDPYVIGMAIFGIFAGSDWYEFNIKGSRIVDLLGES